MNQTHLTILFVSQSADDGQQAETLFSKEAQKAELGWTANSGLLSDLLSMQSQASLIVILEKVDEPLAIPVNIATAVEHWRISASAPPELSKLIQQNIANLIVRLILKGGKRQPTAPQQQSTPLQQAAAKAAAVRVSLESKGRAGKKVSVVSGIPLSASALEDLTTKLKRTCGTGGTLKDGQIEIQGDHRDKLIAELQKLGYKPKRAGG
jgi:translation initiation factor 1